MSNFNVGDVVSIKYLDEKSGDKSYGVIVKKYYIHDHFIVNRFALYKKQYPKIIIIKDILVSKKMITIFDITTLNKDSKLYKQLKIESNKFKLIES
jgi:hypothetical protein